MPPGGGGGEVDHGCTAQDHPPAPVNRNVDASPHSKPPLPAIAPVSSQEKNQRHEHEQQPAASLPEGPLVEILARVPYRSLCRFKCVSKPWLALCSSRDILKRSPQTLSGFFYIKDDIEFHNFSGRGPPLDPSFPFLHEIYTYIYSYQICGGLALCVCLKPGYLPYMKDNCDYVVCNPATEEWTVLPPIVYPYEEFDRPLNPDLGFDAAAPSRFLVFEPLNIDKKHSGKVAIYSSETGQWIYVQSKWSSGPVELNFVGETGVFLNGTMHWSTDHGFIVTVDSEGKVWREIKVPDDLSNSSDSLSIGQSQGCLYAWQIDSYVQLCIWVLEDYSTGKWTVKRTVKMLELLGTHLGEVVDRYEMFAVDPNCNVIFLTSGKSTVSYNLDNQEVHVICAEHMLCGQPYVPCFAELPSAGH